MNLLSKLGIGGKKKTPNISEKARFVVAKDRESDEVSRIAQQIESQTGLVGNHIRIVAEAVHSWIQDPSLLDGINEEDTQESIAKRFKQVSEIHDADPTLLNAIFVNRKQIVAIIRGECQSRVEKREQEAAQQLEKLANWEFSKEYEQYQKSM